MTSMLRIVSLLLAVQATSWALISKATKNLPYTGIQRELDWPLHGPPIPIEAERKLSNSGKLILRGEFGRVSETRVEEIGHACEELGMTLAQGMSVRKQAMVTRTVHSFGQVKKKAPKLSRLLHSKSHNILDLSYQFDQPPVTIMRVILDHRIRECYADALEDSDVKKIVKAIVDGELTGCHLEDFLSTAEQQELEMARQSDATSYVTPGDGSELEASMRWEDALYDYLDEHDINYLKEEALRQAGLSRTPDCLILDDCFIHGKLVRWVDCKNFFGCGTAKHFWKSVQKQSAKYEDAFDGDPGSIVYRHGFSTLLQEKLPNCLMLDSGPLQIPELTPE